MRIIFATNNIHKLNEVKLLSKEKYKNKLFSLNDLNIHINPIENGNSFEENAKIKTMAVYNELKNKNLLNIDDFIISDDSGLVIDYLNGAPGINSARFMGDITQNEKNLKILSLLNGVPFEKRTAKFVDNLCLYSDSIKQYVNFVGEIKGHITKNIKTNGGFGYDPIFGLGENEVENEEITLASIGETKKNNISHRGIAFNKFFVYLENYHNM